MNKVIVMGRLTKDPETKVLTSGKKMARFTLAVNRRSQNGPADFISCTAWDKQAETIEKYVKKGSQLNIAGRITTGDYTGKDGKKVYTWTVTVDELEFCGSKSDSAPKEEEKDDSFVDVPDSFSEEVPFE